MVVGLKCKSEDKVFLGKLIYSGQILWAASTGSQPLGYQVGDVGEEIFREAALVQISAQCKVSFAKEMSCRLGLARASENTLFIASHAGVAWIRNYIIKLYIIELCIFTHFVLS